MFVEYRSYSAEPILIHSNPSNFVFGHNLYKKSCKKYAQTGK